MTNVSRLLACLLLCVLATFARAATFNDIKEILGNRLDEAALQRGEIVWIDLPENETSARALSGVMLLRVNASLPQVLAALENKPAMSHGQTVRITASSNWDSVREHIGNSITPAEQAALLGDKAHEHFNISDDELTRLRQAASNTGNLSQAWVALLQQRSADYQRSGLAANATFGEAAGTTNPSQSLADATDTMRFFQRHYPAFQDHLRHYPQSAGEAHEKSIFFASIEQEDGRPIYSLKHQLVDIGNDHALIAERQFYVSHSLDGLQVTILCLRDGDHTLVGMLNHTFTGKVSGFGQTIAHRIGRAKVREKILPMFESLVAAFPVAP